MMNRKSCNRIVMKCAPPVDLAELESDPSVSKDEMTTQAAGIVPVQKVPDTVFEPDSQLVDKENAAESNIVRGSTSTISTGNSTIESSISEPQPEKQVTTSDFESVRRRIRIICRLILKEYAAGNFPGDKANSLLAYVYNAYFIKDREEDEIARQRAQIADILIEGKCIETMATMLRDLVDKGLTVRFLESEEFTKAAQLSLLLIMTIIHNYTDASVKVCQALVKTDLFETLMKLLRELYRDHRDKKLHEVVDRLPYNAIVASYNHLIHEELDLVEWMNEMGVVRAVQLYLTDEDHEIRAAALLFTIHAVTQEEAAKSCGDEVSIKFILDSLRTAMRSDDRRGNGYSVLELTRALLKLSALDVNKKKLGDLGSIELLKELIETGKLQEKGIAIKILWQLSFDIENARKIRGMVELASSISTSPDDLYGIKRSTEGLLWTINEKTDNKENNKRRISSPSSCKKKKASSSKRDMISISEKAKDVQVLDASTKSDDSHIMISYEWSSQKTIIKIKNEIAEAGHKVWLDVDNMGHNTLDSMAAAVEKCWLIIMSVSRKYKESENCRLEAEYAFRLKKPIIPLMMDRYRPDGWLGFMIGAKLYYDFSGKYEFQTKLSELLTAIHKNIGGDIKMDIPDGLKQLSPVVKEPEIVSATTERLESTPLKDLSYLDSWGSDRVNEWCRENDIEWTGFMSVTGKELRFLATARRECPDFFYRCMETKLELRTLKQMANFVDAINNL